MFRAEVHGGGSGHCKNKICDVCIYVIDSCNKININGQFFRLMFPFSFFSYMCM